MALLTEELLKKWEDFKHALVTRETDQTFNYLIKANGMQIKHMVYENGIIRFNIQTNFDVIIPYTILAGGIESCIKYASNEIEYLLNNRKRIA